MLLLILRKKYFDVNLNKLHRITYSLFFCLAFLISETHAEGAAVIDSTGKDSIRKNSFLPVPILNYSPETSFLFGISALHTFYLGKDSITRPSFAFITGIYTLKKQIISDLYINSWGKENKYHYLFDLSYLKYNYFYYGIGNETKLSNEEMLDQKKLELSFNIERKITNTFYAGADVSYKNDHYSAPWTTGIWDPVNTIGAKGGKIPRAGVAFIYDSRDTYTDARKGNYAKLNLSHTMPGISDFDFTKVAFESRHFFTLKEKHTFGFNTNIETTQGQQPFFELRTMGSPFMMRGYYTGRFRDQNYVAAQTEYRYRFSKRVGVVAFAGTGMVFRNDNFALARLKPNYGIGLRYFYDPASRINIRLDYGFGAKSPGEKRINNFYLFIGEAF